MTDLLPACLSALRAATEACRLVQQRLVTPATLEKKDKSPVTVADFASQALVCAHLAETGIPIVAEEHADELEKPVREATRRSVTDTLSTVLRRPVSQEQALEWIRSGGASASGGRYWTLDPIDGTKGFLRRQQYAIALALIESGRVTLAALACPGLDEGVLLCARAGAGTRQLPLWSWSGPDDGMLLRVGTSSDMTVARFCESVESAHSDQGASASIAALLGITAPPIRMDSQAKYATLARGQAQVYLRLPTSDTYRENIWDHAAGLLCVEEAGGRVTDVAGRSLDFSTGRRFERNRGVVATIGVTHQRVIDAVGRVLARTIPHQRV